MPSPSFFICTFGCRCNQADSAALRERLCRASLAEATRFEEAGLIVVNSCTVTLRTDQQVRQAVRKFRRENPQARLVVTGCYAQRDPEALAGIEGVDLVVGNADRGRLPEILDRPANLGPLKIFRSPLASTPVMPVDPQVRTGGRTRPLLKVQDGCDARCAYCIVPSVRGPCRSAEPDEVLREVRRLVEAGYREIVLAGVHLGSYGRRMNPRLRLADLLGRILDVPGLGRLRLSSIEPMRFDRKIVRMAAGSPALARHFHIPLQSGSDRILRRMRRPYTAGRYLELLDFVRDLVPDAALGTDILVGFPGERDSDYRATCDLVERSPLSYLHVFPFSARPGTAAAAMPEQVPPEVVQERTAALRALSREKNLAFRRRFLGRPLPAVTLAREEEMGASVVLTDNYIHARVSRLDVEPNRLVDILLVEAGPRDTVAVLA